MATEGPAETGRAAPASAARHRAPPWWSPWRASFIVGLVTVILGLIVAFRPAQSLAVVMVLFGVLLIISGAYQVARMFDSADRDRVWRGVAAAAFIIAGLVMIRHMQFSLAVIGLVIGVTWVLQGVVLLAVSLSLGPRAHAGWTAFFGVLSLIAGIVVMAAPAVSVATLTSLVGAWFVVMGLLELFGALLFRRAAPRTDGTAGAARAGTGDAAVPGQRAGESAPGRRMETR
jgi:uncharacterized membrane protein HdeD (DUF308 family)